MLPDKEKDQNQSQRGSQIVQSGTVKPTTTSSGEESKEVDSGKKAIVIIKPVNANIGGVSYRLKPQKSGQILPTDVAYAIQQSGKGYIK